MAAESYEQEQSRQELTVKPKEMTKRMLTGIFSLVLVLSITGCGRGSSEKTEASGTGEELPPEVQESIDQAVREAEAAAAPANPQNGAAPAATE